MRRGLLTACVALAMCAAPAAGQMPPFAGGAGAQMPDARQMSGMPLPVSDLPVGTVTVRVVRGAVTNPLPGEMVTLSVGGAPQSAKTDQDGRATFSGLAVGAHVTASSVVNGEKLDSQQFEVPAAGGIRLALVATDPAMAKRTEEDRALATAAPIDGTVVLGDQSRIVIEMGDDGLNVFNILQVVNTARRPVKIAAPLDFDVPEDAIGLGLLDGAPKSAIASGHRVSVAGPFPPGATTLQFAYTLPFGRAAMQIRQRMPAPLSAVAVLVQTTGAMRLASPQIAQQRSASADGQSYIVGEGPGVPAGTTIALDLTGLPHAPTWPRDLALSLASIVLVGGAWAAATRRTGGGDAERRRELQETRERLFVSLTGLEQQHRRGELDEAHYGERRRELIASLERVYAELDEEAAA